MLASDDNPIGVEREACKRPALVPLDRLGNLDGNMRPLSDAVRLHGLWVA